MNSRRMYGLDLFRVLAALVVFMYHNGWKNYGIFNAFFSMGAIFMTAFFMMSGFTLFCVQENFLFEEGDQHISNLLVVYILLRNFVKWTAYRQNYGYANKNFGITIFVALYYHGGLVRRNGNVVYFLYFILLSFFSFYI